MKSFSLFGNEAPWYFRKLVTDIREESLRLGVDPADFPEYLKNQGIQIIQMDGPFLLITDELMTYAELKYG